MDLDAQLIRLEQSLHDHTTRNKGELAGALLHPLFQEIGRSGRTYNKGDILTHMAKENFANETVYSQSYQLQRMSDDLVQLVYQSAIKADSGQLTAFSLRSSLWQRVKGQWLLRFHQGTPTSAFSITDSRGQEIENE